MKPSVQDAGVGGPFLGGMGPMANGWAFEVCLSMDFMLNFLA